MRCSKRPTGRIPLVARAGAVVLLLLSMACAAVGPPALRPQKKGKLDKLRDEVKSSGREDRDGSNKDGESATSELAGEILSDLLADEIEGLGSAIGMILLGPFTVPHMLIGDDLGRNGHFFAYPYARSRGGTMRLGNHDSAEPLQDWTLHLATEQGNDFDGLTRTGLRLLLDTSSRFGLKGRLDYLREDLAGRDTDSLFLGDLNAVFRFAQSESIQFRTGLGVNFLLDQDVHRAGLNFVYAADIYPLRPFDFSASVNAGQLGDANILHLRATAGVQLSLFEIYAGYDYLDIGSTTIDGPLAGVRFFF